MLGADKILTFETTNSKAKTIDEFVMFMDNCLHELKQIQTTDVIYNWRIDFHKKATNVISKVILTQLNEALNVQIVATPTLNMQTLWNAPADI